MISPETLELDRQIKDRRISVVQIDFRLDISDEVVTDC